MRMPWTKRDATDSRPAGPVSKSEAARSGPAGDGKEHDLKYWLESGFLTLPKNAVKRPKQRRQSTRR
jgi:hypothetical protein